MADRSRIPTRVLEEAEPPRWQLFSTILTRIRQGSKSQLSRPQRPKPRIRYNNGELVLRQRHVRPPRSTPPSSNELPTLPIEPTKSAPATFSRNNDSSTPTHRYTNNSPRHRPR